MCLVLQKLRPGSRLSIYNASTQLLPLKHVCVHVCVCERERFCVRDVCERDVHVCIWMCESVCVCVCVRERVCVCLRRCCPLQVCMSNQPLASAESSFLCVDADFLSTGRVSGEQLSSCVQLFRGSWGAIESNAGVLQLALATAHTLRHPARAHWDTCLAFERLLLQVHTHTHTQHTHRAQDRKSVV